MTILENKAIQISIKNLKDKLRHWQYMFFSLLLPIMFTLMFYFMFGHEEDPTGRTGFDYGFPGMIMYAIGMGTMNAAIMFAQDKSSGMLNRLDTMPTGRKNMFLGALISESLFLMFQIVIMFIIGYAILGLYYEGPLELFFGFLIAVLFGISAVGLGIIIASISKNVEVANAFSLLVYMLLIFLSGSLMPFESPIVYFTPPYWAKQIFLQLTVLGHGLNDNLYNSSLIGAGAVTIPITLFGGLLIVVMYTIVFIILGIIVFQKKTKF
ncbi:MAG: ABC transporter permease [Promethearchaeota archaeon]|nr:MAG: ABC transporter permease [Candidatus Lokiarchaeota archaeon]